MKCLPLAAVGAVTALVLLGACGDDKSAKPEGGAATESPATTEAPTTATSAATTTTAAPTTTTSAAPTTVTTAATTTTKAAPTTTRPAAFTVAVKQFQFMPAQLTVPTGTKVTWTNQDQILHTATSGATPGMADGKFDGPMDGTGKSFSFTFGQPGTYPYFCSRHTSMTGTIVVQ